MNATYPDFKRDLCELLAQPLQDTQIKAIRRFDEACPDDALFLYGAGGAGQRAAQILRQNGKKVLGIIDADPEKNGCYLGDIPIFSLRNIPDIIKNSIPVLICVFNREPYSDINNIISSLTQHGIKNIIPFSYFLWKFHRQTLPWFGFGLPSDVLPHISKIEEAFSLFGDEISLRTFLEMLRTSILADFETFTSPASGPQYFSQEIQKRISWPLYMADGGAYDGDTLKNFLEHIGHEKLGHWYAFEPDPVTFKKLESYITTLSSDIRNKVTCIPSALSSVHENINLTGDGTESSKIQNNINGIPIKTITLDSIFEHIPCNYIKLDIEGYEKNALLGAKETIKRDVPSLAVCVYHKPCDFFELPILISNLIPNKKLLLRRYGSYFYECVCYATP